MRPVLTRRLAATGAVVAAAVLVGGPLAGAHTELRSSLPAPGQAVGGTVERVELEFFGPIIAAEISIADHDGHAVANTGEPEIDENVVVQRFEPLRHPGEHIVTWSIIARDGDPLDAAFAFTYDRDADPLPEPDTGNRTGGTILAIVATTLLVGLAIILLRKPKEPAET